MATINKFIHGWQYTGSKQRQIDPTTTESTCRHCGELEHQFHYMCCAAHTWRPYKQKAWTTLRRKLRQCTTNPTIMSAISIALSKNLLPQIITFSSDYSHPPSEAIALSAAREQHEIGWQHLFQGRISKKWTTAQKVYLRSLPTPTGTYSAEKDINQWRKQFIMSLLQYGLDLWESRNSSIHGSNPTETRSTRRQKASARVSELFADGPQSVPSFQENLFKLHESRRLQMRTAQMEHWINVVELAQTIHSTNLSKYGRQSTLLENNFIPVPTDSTPADNTSLNHSTKCPSRTSRSSLTTSNNSKVSWVDQDLRELLLISTPNVRYRQVDSQETLSDP